MNAEVRERILQATYDCVARWGLAKTSIEDAAREAGLSRATIYRYFPGGRDELIGAVVQWEFVRFFLRLYEEVRDVDTLEEVMEKGTDLRPSRRARAPGAPAHLGHRARDPAALHDGVGQPDPRWVSAFLKPYLVRHGMHEGADLERAADFLARMVLSYIGSPGRWDLDDPAQVARLVRCELLAGIR